jgi:cyclase
VFYGVKLDKNYSHKGACMEIIRIDSVVTAFIRPVEGVNAGLIHTPNGMIMIDTTSSPAEASGLLDAVGAHLNEVRMVINTHSHSDHTWGNQLFTCPILAHRLCQECMQSSIKNEWSKVEIQAYISELKKTDPKRADDLRWTVTDLHITLPDQVFDERFEGELGGIKFEVIHMGGHTPDLSVVWLPESRILYASDLIFQGRYPYIFDADIPAWIDRLGKLMEFRASAIIPGHGVMCGEAEIITLREYLQSTWERTVDHIRLGHRANEIATAPGYPRFPGEKYESLHQANIRYMYKQLTR